MVVERFTDGNTLYAKELNNKFSTAGNVTVGKSGVIYIHVPILSSGDTPKVRLYLFGKTAGSAANKFNHGMLVDHYHSLYAESGTSYTGFITSNENANQRILNMGDGNNVARMSVGNVIHSSDSINAPTKQRLISHTNVPKTLKIYIDGTDYTSTIGDPNSKGSTMYDSTSNAWGVDGTTEWDTGELDLSSVITWSQGDHYIELKETGDVGGTLIYTVMVN